MPRAESYDYRITNDEVDKTVEELAALVKRVRGTGSPHPRK